MNMRSKRRYIVVAAATRIRRRCIFIRQVAKMMHDAAQGSQRCGNTSAGGWGSEGVGGGVMTAEVLPAARSEPTSWLTPASTEARAGDGARFRDALEVFLLSAAPREVDEPPRGCSCCLGAAKPPPVRCRGASELLARSDEDRCLCGDKEDTRRRLRWRADVSLWDAEAIMERALRRAEEERSGLEELLLSLALDDSTTLGMMKPGAAKGGRGGSRLVEGRALLLPRLDGMRRGGGAAAMLSGDSAPPLPHEDPLWGSGGDCRPPCERGKSRSNSPLSACCACDKGGGGFGWL